MDTSLQLAKSGFKSQAGQRIFVKFVLINCICIVTIVNQAVNVHLTTQQHKVKSFLYFIWAKIQYNLT